MRDEIDSVTGDRWLSLVKDALVQVFWPKFQARMEQSDVAVVRTAKMMRRIYRLQLKNQKRLDRLERGFE